MLTWIKANVIPVLFCTISSLVAGLAIMFTLWQGAMHDAETYKHVAEQQVKVIEAQSRITQHETQVNRVTERVVQRIMETPNANTPLPPDVADAWLASINSVRNSAEGTPDGPDANLHGLTGGGPDEHNGNDSGATSVDIKPTRSRFSKLQLPAQ